MNNEAFELREIVREVSYRRTQQQVAEDYGIPVVEFRKLLHYQHIFNEKIKGKPVLLYNEEADLLKKYRNSLLKAKEDLKI